jgi:hypothetical protein
MVTTGRQMWTGYYSAPGAEVLELSTIDTIWDINARSSNFISGSTVDAPVIQYTPHGKKKHLIKVDALGHGPLLLVANEGKVALFDRA